MKSTDQDLIDQSLRGSKPAFGELVGRYQDRLFHSLTRVLGSSEDAKDTTQEAFVHAFQKLHTYRGGAQFYSWLFRIALNSAVSLHRKKNHSTTSLDAAREQLGKEPVDPRPAASPDAHLELVEQQTLVRAALAALPEEFREVLVLKEIDGLKYEEIAEIVNCPVGTVRSRIFRARFELRNRLEVLLRRQEK